MATIQTAFSISANKSSATTTPGPLSVALSASASNSLTVDNVRSEIVTVPDHSGESDEATRIIDGSNYTSGTAGTHGGYVYMKNISAASASTYIMIGVEAEGVADGSLADISDASDALRLMSLKVGEWAFFPFDYNQDITARASADGQLLEYWVFDRA